MNQSLHDSLQAAFDELTSFLLDNVADDKTWEDSFPELDNIRAAIGDLLS